MRDRAQHCFYTPLAMRLPEPVGIFAPVPPGLKPPITIAMLPGKNDPRQPINPPDVSRRLFNTTPPPLTPRTERETQNGVSNPIDGYIYCLGH
ncbi:MAG TPA: hypothetical protein VN989_05725, partial [Casimicrobiaceae bacterium]|nr:hypothetical protein [Casimicrobiaceae bacterium]